MARPTRPRNTSPVSSSDEEGNRSCQNLWDFDEKEIENLEDARKVIRELKDRYRIQGRQLLICRRKLKKQDEITARFLQEKADQLKALSCQLLLFEARLMRKQKDIDHMLSQRDALIARQRKALNNSQSSDISSIPTDSPTESLNDSDSAVAFEEVNDNESNLRGLRSCSVESVSFIDAVKSDDKRQLVGILRRSRIMNELENDLATDSETKEPEIKSIDLSNETKRLGNVEASREGTFEKLQNTLSPHKTRQETIGHVITYGKIMSNHRSVIKPKDVKNKRINKTIKSKSLEELG